ncbi:MAG: YitT family protein [Clostridia bacterium]|nr:YitT family protein [Clostridia bacterium]
MFKSKILPTIREYAILTFAGLLMAVGIYVFKFPNNFSFGGVSGISIILSRLFPLSQATFNLILNLALMFAGIIILGGSFGAKTAYVTMVVSLSTSAMELLFPMTESLSGEPLLDLVFAVALPAIASAILFNRDASSGGTDIIAMIVKKHTSFNIGTALMLADVIVAVSAFFLFGPATGLYSVCGLTAKCLVIDSVIERINLCKVFTIICTDPEPICKFITDDLTRSATVHRATGAYTHEEKFVIISILSRTQAVALRNFIRKTDPKAFFSISNSSEIIGKGFANHI